MLAILGACILGVLVAAIAAVLVAIQQHTNATDTTTTMGPVCVAEGS
jgi:hypothetical protein